METEHHELSAYLDDELTPAERRRVEARLTLEPGYAQELRALERTRTMILTAIEQPAFHDTLMTRVREQMKPPAKTHWKRYALAAALLVAVAGLAFYATRVPAPPPGQHAVAPPPMMEQDRPAPTPPFEQVAQAPLELPPPAETSAAVELPRLKVLGTILGEEPQAVISVDSQRSRNINVGEELAPGITLVEVLEGRVVLLADGQKVTLGVGDDSQDDPQAILDGSWFMSEVLPDGRSGGEGEPIKISHSGSEILLDMEEGTGGRIKGTLEVRPNDFSLTLDEGKFLGRVSGDGSTVDIVQDMEVTEPGQRAQRFRLTRASAGEAASIEATRAAKEQCSAELEVLHEALKNYREAEGDLPRQLSALLPDYLSEPALIESTPERAVKYYYPSGGAVVSPAKEADLRKGSNGGENRSIAERALSKGRNENTSFLPELEVPQEPGLDPQETYADRLMAHEEQLRKIGYASLLWPDALLVIEFPKMKVTGTLFLNGSVQVKESFENASSAAGESVLAAMRASDQNNLKQLGLIVKMYANEHRGWAPPGFLSVYPEYLTDPKVLTSPKDQPGTVSYEYLLPATQLEEGLFEEVLANQDPRFIDKLLDENGQLEPGAEGTFQSLVPIMINKSDWPDGGRNILFADGHVEYAKNWRERLELIP